MAARRAAAAAASSPAGLKIKVKAGVGAAKGKKSKEGPPQESGEDDVAADGGVVTNNSNNNKSNARMLKRKRLTPPGSPAVSKRPPRGSQSQDSQQHPPANGEPAAANESVPKKQVASKQAASKQVATTTDVNAVKKQDSVEKPDESVNEPKKQDEGIKACSNAQGDLQVSSGATTDAVAATPSAAAPKADVNTSGDQPVATAVQVSSSLATSSLTTQAEEEKHHTIPSHAGWYSWTEIHTLEKRGLPEFFSGKLPGKSPELYMEYRNIIMKKYRENLRKVLTVADVQEQLNGVEAKSIHRIMEFLDHWGLINYAAPTEFLPSWKHCSPIVESDAALMLRALPRRGSNLYHVDPSCTPALQRSPVKSKTTDAVIAEMLAFGEGAEVDYHCNSCSADCSKQRYHCQKQADFDLCPDCYNEGLFGPDMVSADFIKMDVTTASNANGGGWSDQETLLLLEALELYGDNWNEIAEHVATKSKSQCILHFIKLPVEDAFSDHAAKSASTSNAAPATTPISQTDSTLEGEQEEKETGEKGPEDDAAIEPSTDKAEEPRREELVLPPNLAAFAEAGNPVMAQMAFLATMIGSLLGREAAQAALEALNTKDPGVHLAAGTAMILEDPVPDVEPSTSQHPDRSGQADEEMQSGEETTAKSGEAAPSPAAAAAAAAATAGGKQPVSDATASAQNDEDAPPPTEQEPRQESNLGKEISLKSDAPKSLNVLEEAKVAGRVKRAAASAIAAASVKAKLLADQEEREMKRLMEDVIEKQSKKLELKLKFLNELQASIGKECEVVDRDRTNYVADHARIAAQRLSGASSGNPPSSPPRQQQHQALVLAQPPPPPFQGGQNIYGHGFQQAMNHHQMGPNHAAFVQQQMYQGLTNSMNAGAIQSLQQSHGLQRQMMMSAPHMLGRQQQLGDLPPPPPIMMGRPMLSTSDQGPAGLPGIMRPLPQ